MIGLGAFIIRGSYRKEAGMASVNLRIEDLLQGLRSLEAVNPVTEFVSREERDAHPDHKPVPVTRNGLPVYDVSVMSMGHSFDRDVPSPLTIRVPMDQATQGQIGFGTVLVFDGLTITLRDGDGRQKYVTISADAVHVQDADDADSSGVTFQLDSQSKKSGGKS